MTFINCTFTNNQIINTTSVNGHGGAIYNIGNNMKIENCTFIENININQVINSNLGGAIYNNGANMTIVNSTFNNNNATSKGGAIYNNGNGVNILNCSFDNNWAFYKIGYSTAGGAIYNENGANLTIDGCIFSANYGYDGGAIYNNGNTANMNVFNSIFNNNLATITISGITTGNCGGAIFNSGVNGNIINCSFNNNAAEGGGAIENRNYGFAIFITSSNLNIINCNFTNNTALLGGGINNGGANVDIANCNFDNNTANVEGGAIWNDGINMTVINCDFNNNSVDDAGGAIYNCKYGMTSDGGNLNVFNCTFNNNSAKNNGGAISNGGVYPNTGASNLNIFNCTFNNNTAEKTGGAIYNDNGGNMSVINCNFTNNSQAIYLKATDNKIIGCNIVNNDIGILIASGSVNTTINYNRIFNNTFVSGFDLTNNGVNTNGNLNWWGSNNPLVNNINLENWFVIELSVNNYNTTANDTISLPTGTYNLYYKFVLFDNSTKSTSVVDTSKLPNFSVIITWKVNGKTFNMTIDEAKGLYYQNVLIKQSGLIEAQADNEDINLKIESDGLFDTNSTIVVKDTANVNESVFISGVLSDEEGNPIADTDLKLTINGESFTVTTNKDGEWNYTYTTKIDGTVELTINWEGDSVYNGFTNGSGFNVVKIDTNISINVPENITLPSNNVNEKIINITGVLTDIEGNPIAKTTVTIIIDGETYTTATDDYGVWEVSFIATHSGNISVIAKYKGSKIYNPSENIDYFIIGIQEIADNITTNEENQSEEDSDETSDDEIDFKKKEAENDADNEDNEDNETDDGNDATNTENKVNSLAMKKTGIPTFVIILVLISLFVIGAIIKR